MSLAMHLQSLPMYDDGFSLIFINISEKTNMLKTLEKGFPFIFEPTF